MRLARRLLLVFALVFLLPVIASTAMWAVADRPDSWHSANWDTAGLLPSPDEEMEAVIHIMAARTGGLKGAVSVHSWIVLKNADERGYRRYDKVGWGMPVRLNNWPPDARWYSNAPFFVRSIRGEEAAELIPGVETAIESYPHNARGGYRIWPGPNSNSFVAHVLREVPELGVSLPPTAIGRDYLTSGEFFHVDEDWLDFHATLFGLAGIALGVRSGVEIHLFGLVAGLDLARPGVKIPAFGRIGL